jgi:hypothetical protein
VPSRVSMIFYFGLEGLGGMDMDTNEDENARFKLLFPMNMGHGNLYLRIGFRGRCKTLRIHSRAGRVHNSDR